MGFVVVGEELGTFAESRKFRYCRIIYTKLGCFSKNYKLWEKITWLLSWLGRSIHKTNGFKVNIK